MGLRTCTEIQKRKRQKGYDWDEQGKYFETWHPVLMIECWGGGQKQFRSSCISVHIAHNSTFIWFCNFEFHAVVVLTKGTIYRIIHHFCTKVKPSIPNSRCFHVFDNSHLKSIYDCYCPVLHSRDQAFGKTYLEIVNENIMVVWLVLHHPFPCVIHFISVNFCDSIKQTGDKS